MKETHLIDRPAMNLLDRAVEVGLLKIGASPRATDSPVFYTKLRLAEHVREALGLRLTGLHRNRFRYSLPVPVPISEATGAINAVHELEGMFAIFSKVPIRIVSSLLRKHGVSMDADDFVDAAGWDNADGIIRKQPESDGGIQSPWEGKP